MLGNCLYDKAYLKKVQSMKVEPVKFQEDTLHRHPDFAPKVKEEMTMVKREPHQTPVRTNAMLRTRTDHLGASISGEFDDEFDGNLFDGVDISENAGEEFSFESAAAGSVNGINGATPSRNAPLPNGPPRQPDPRAQNAPVARGANSAQQVPQSNMQNGPGRPAVGPSNARAPQTPMQNSNSRPDPNRPRMQPPIVDIHAAPKPQNHNQNAQPQQQQQQHPRPAAQPSAASTSNPPSNHRPPVGFVTSRAAELLQNPEPPTSLTNLPAFNPNVESPIPKDQRTPGLDHASSKPIKRDAVNAPPPPPPNLAPAGGGGGTGGFNRPGMGPRGNSNFVNPQQDANRRIGMPSPGGGMNRGQYKPPMKRPPLQDVSNQGGPPGGGGEPEAKRQKVEGVGVEKEKEKEKENGGGVAAGGS